jgi:nucleotide-binding universal stress UspA family protein
VSETLSARTILVGIDGSAESFAALDWARRIVGPQGRVDAVHVAQPGDPDGERVASERGIADRGEPPLTVIEGDPVDTLLAAAAETGAGLIAIGVHGRAIAGPRLLGRMARGLVTRSDRPIAIVRDGAQAAASDGMTVVAGVGHGPATNAAVDWAVSFATAHGTALSLVHGLVHRPLFSEDGLLDVIAWYIDPYKIGEWARQDLEDLADDIQRSTEQDLEITWTAPAGRPGPSLVDASENASLLVMGRHADQDGIGSTLHHALIHAPCPVVIVPAVDGED